MDRRRGFSPNHEKEKKKKQPHTRGLTVKK